MGKNKESGMMVVEAVISFTVFIMAVVCIISLINVYMVHNKVQFAINSSANELAGYLYLYDVMGLHTVHNDGDKYVDKLTGSAADIIDSYNKIGEVGSRISGGDFSKIESDADDLKASLDKSYSDIKNYIDNPNELLVGLIYGGYEMLESGTVGLLIRLLSAKYIDTADKSADEYLKGFGVTQGYDGLEFRRTRFLQDEDGKMIDVVVEYDMEVMFLGMFLPDSSIHVVQRVSVPAWLCGDGEELPDFAD